MASNPRLSVTFTAKQLARIEKGAARLDITVGAMVRQIIDSHFDDYSKWAAMAEWRKSKAGRAMFTKEKEK